MSEAINGTIRGRHVIPAASGWDLIKVNFGEYLEVPEVVHIPIIGWQLCDDHVLPVFPDPWAQLNGRIEMELEYQAYMRPDGRIIGHPIMEEPVCLQTFVDYCARTEYFARAYDKNDGDPPPPPLPRRVYGEKGLADYLSPPP